MKSFLGLKSDRLRSQHTKEIGRATMNSKHAVLDYSIKCEDFKLDSG